MPESVIVSASYRTDIPAFYGDWFRTRFRAGFALVASPYGGPPARIPLRPRPDRGVDGFVFWTRNAAPFDAALADVAEAGLPFVVQYTVTGYPRALEASVPEAARSVAVMRDLAKAYGARALVWRYDPILVSDLTPPAWHLENFATLARALEGVTDEAVTSFAAPYRKTVRRLAQVAREGGFAWRDPDMAEKTELLAGLARIAGDFGMRLTLCTQPELAVPGTAPAACIDARRLGDVAGRPIVAVTRGNRPGCLCAASRDIGAYDSCPQGCVYCYAVNSDAAAVRRLRSHDPKGEMIVSPRH
jgi:hypothetical protein